MDDKYQLQIFCDGFHADNIYFEKLEEIDQFIENFQVEHLNEEVQQYITIETVEFYVNDLINEKLVKHVTKTI